MTEIGNRKYFEPIASNCLCSFGVVLDERQTAWALTELG
jgi:hypothetical protein